MTRLKSQKNVWRLSRLLNSGSRRRRNHTARLAAPSEILEIRTVPSAVSAHLVGGSLIVTGASNQAKTLSIHQDDTDPGKLVVAGSSGTIVNGVAAVGGVSAQTFTLARLTAGVRVDLSGSTNLSVVGIDGKTLNGNVTVTLRSNGQHHVSLSDLATKGALRVTTSGGNDLIQLTNLSIRGSSKISSGNGNDHVIAQKNSLHTTSVDAGLGNDVVDLRSSTTSNLSVRNRGAAAVMLQNDQIKGHLTVTGVHGEQTYLVSGVTITKTTSITTGRESDHLGLYNSNLNGTATIKLGAGDDVASVEGATFSKALKLSGGADEDELTLEFGTHNTTNSTARLTGFEDKELELVKDVHFSYSGTTGPTLWGQLTPAFIRAAVGVEQSPINIDTSTAREQDLPNIAFDYSAQSDLTYFNNGHTIQVTAKPGNSITVDNTDFQLKQFHLHTPSENQLNGQQFDGEMHLVHADALGNLAVVGVFLKIDDSVASNSVLPQLAAAPPTTEGSNQILAGPLNLADLLPTDQRYYRFNGSLTTPPASEGVKWFVLPTPISISQSDFDALHNAIGENNNRPVQAVNGRTILFDATA